MAEYPIVALGSSAGGLKPLEAFFRATPPDTGMAFVVAAHLDPTRESHLAEILARFTPMPVVEVSETTALEKNRVHVISPDTTLTIRDHVLLVKKPDEPRGHRRPVDAFFRSLAEARKELAVGVVLSGTGTNGSAGLRLIKAAGGLTVVQDPETAEHGGMPRAAIATGVVDLVLPPSRMPEAIVAYARQALEAPAAARVEADEDNTHLNTLLAVLRARSKQEFRAYKKTTLLRRVHRRLGLRRVPDLERYVELVRQDPHELTALVRDLTINVTSFFRDPAAWLFLEEHVIGPLVRERDGRAPIRMWTPGCSTGEEAYTLAMLLTEQAEAARVALEVKIFATDVADAVLSRAREGLFPGSVEEEIGEQRLARFFDKEDDAYRVKKPLREMVVFAPQNLLQDPPFSRLDLITCRNLMIYFEPEVQKRVLGLFHFALREDGHLFLGGAETIASREELFGQVSSKHRIYRRLGPTRHDVAQFPVIGARARGKREPGGEATTYPAGPRPPDLARRALAERHAPPSVLVDLRLKVLSYHGATGEYLRQPDGEPTDNLAALAREGLAPRLRSAANEAARTGEEVAFDGRYAGEGGEAKTVRVRVAPLPDRQRHGGYLLVSFLAAEGRAEGTPDANKAPKGTGAASSEEALKGEIVALREELRLTVEQMESSNEELKASNEEITSINEEYQSTNEELETSKEELQSLNEELNTVNNQLQRKVEELETRTAYLNNLLNSTAIATLFLDLNLHVRWFTPGMTGLLDLLPTDVGRPVAHFARHFTGDLTAAARAVLERLVPAQEEVQGQDGRCFIQVVTPYRTPDDRIDGVVVTFTDITERRRAERALAASEESFRKLFELTDEGVLEAEVIFDVDGRAVDVLYHDANPAAVRVVKADFKGRRLSEVSPDFEAHWCELPGRVALSGENERKELYAAPLDQWFEVHAFKTGGENRVGIFFRDVTERRRATEEREQLVGELNHRVKNVFTVVQALAMQTVGDGTAQGYRRTFLERLSALVKAHNLLFEGGWSGADLAELADACLAPYRNRHGDRIALSGPKVALDARQAVTSAMVLHEMATNAVKHGALSVPEGRVSLTWEVEAEGAPPRLRMVWREQDGPPVNVPESRSFGTRTIERAFAYELDGEAALEFLPEGVRLTAAFPLSRQDPP